MAEPGLTRDRRRTRPSAAGVALWAAEGGSVFLANAFAAVMTCF